MLRRASIIEELDTRDGRPWVTFRVVADRTGSTVVRSFGYTDVTDPAELRRWAVERAWANGWSVH